MRNATTGKGNKISNLIQYAFKFEGDRTKCEKKISEMKN